MMMCFVVLLCSGSEVDMVHCVVDRNLITGQNDQSTVVAVQNVILACSLQYDSYLLLFVSVQLPVSFLLVFNKTESKLFVQVSKSVAHIGRLT